MGVVLWLLIGQITLAQQITTVAGGNGPGSTANKLYGPRGMYVDGAGNLFVADQNNSRVQKFPPNSTSATAGTTVAGGKGQSISNHLSSPTSVYVDRVGNLFVADQGNNRVQMFPPNSTSATTGTTVAGGNGYGSEANQLSTPTGIYIDGAGNLFVADQGNNRVQMFPPSSTSAIVGVTVAGGNGLGSAANQLNSPVGVYVDGAGNLLVVDQNNNRIQKFPPNSTSATAGVTVAGGNEQGGMATQLQYPNGVYMDGAGNLYVSDFFNDRIQRFPPNSTSATLGMTIAGGKGQGSAANQLYAPQGVYVDNVGDLYVADFYNFRVQKYSYPPMILSQPVTNSLVCTGATVTAQVSVTATVPGSALTYQWYSASGPLNSQTSPILSLTNVQASQASTYYVVVTSPNGFSTVSTNFGLSLLAPPAAALIASGSLSAATPSVTLTASGGGTYQFSSGATQLGIGPTATVSTPGLYYVKVTGTNGCSDVASTSVSQAPTPDLSPLLYARPTGVYGSTPVTVVVDVTELNGVASSGLITLKITQDDKLALSLPATATSIGNRPVNNSAWQLSGPSGGYYTLTTNQAVPASGMLSVGLTASLSLGGSSGAMTVSGILMGGSGGDQKILNNIASGRIDYFQQ